MVIKRFGKLLWKHIHFEGALWKLNKSFFLLMDSFQLAPDCSNFQLMIQHSQYQASSAVWRFDSALTTSPKAIYEKLGRRDLLNFSINLKGKWHSEIWWLVLLFGYWNHLSRWYGSIPGSHMELLHSFIQTAHCLDNSGVLQIQFLTWREEEMSTRALILKLFSRGPGFLRILSWVLQWKNYNGR